MLNHIDIQGRLVKEPEMRTTNSGIAVTTFTLAHDRDFQKDAVDFVDCVAWRQTGEFVSKYFHKGQLAIVSGRLQSRKWEDRDGNKRTNWEIQCDNVYFGESKRNDSGDGYSAGEPQYTPPKKPDVIADDEEELPF